MIVLAATILATALAQTATTVTVEREDATFTIRNLGLSADGARSFFQNPNCDEEALLDIFYAPSPGVIETEVDDGTLLTSGVAIIRRPRDEGANGDGGSDGETIELFSAEMTFDRPRCPDEVTPLEAPPVTLTQGRTVVVGSRFLLEPGSDIGSMAGPVSLERAAEGDSPALSGTADELTFDLESDRTTLIGGVTLVSEGRTSEADRLELDEDAGVAILTGDPARSTEEGNVLEGARLIYYLDTNDVVVEGDVRGLVEFE
jgi:lipopolysaccharide export system protein LptA